MWFEYADNHETIKELYNNELSLDDAYFETIIFCDMNTVRIVFISDKLPRVFPEEWNKYPFNSLSISLVFTDIKSLKISSSRIAFVCTPEFFLENNQIHVVINSQDDHFELVAGSMSIGKLYPSKVDDLYWITVRL